MTNTIHPVPREKEVLHPKGAKTTNRRWHKKALNNNPRKPPIKRHLNHPRETYEQIPRKKVRQDTEESAEENIRNKIKKPEQSKTKL